MITIIARQVSQRDQEIGFRIRQARQLRGLSQTDVAELLGISFQQLQKYEQGRNRISAVRLLDIARVLNIGIDQLLDFQHVLNITTSTFDLHPDDMVIINLWRNLTNTQSRQLVLTIMETMINERRDTTSKTE
jgi:transcriptional regulator with XRE-family HTH domain